MKHMGRLKAKSCRGLSFGDPIDLCGEREEDKQDRKGAGSSDEYDDETLAEINAIFDVDDSCDSDDPDDGAWRGSRRKGKSSRGRSRRAKRSKRKPASSTTAPATPAPATMATTPACSQRRRSLRTAAVHSVAAFTAALSSDRLPRSPPAASSSCLTGSVSKGTKRRRQHATPLLTWDGTLVTVKVAGLTIFPNHDDDTHTSHKTKKHSCLTPASPSPTPTSSLGDVRIMVVGGVRTIVRQRTTPTLPPSRKRPTSYHPPANPRAKQEWDWDTNTKPISPSIVTSMPTNTTPNPFSLITHTKPNYNNNNNNNKTKLRILDPQQVQSTHHYALSPPNNTYKKGHASKSTPDLVPSCNKSSSIPTFVPPTPKTASPPRSSSFVYHSPSTFWHELDRDTSDEEEDEDSDYSEAYPPSRRPKLGQNTRRKKKNKKPSSQTRRGVKYISCHDAAAEEEYDEEEEEQAILHSRRTKYTSLCTDDSDQVVDQVADQVLSSPPIDTWKRPKMASSNKQKNSTKGASRVVPTTSSDSSTASSKPPQKNLPKNAASSIIQRRRTGGGSWKKTNALDDQGDDTSDVDGNSDDAEEVDSEEDKEQPLNKDNQKDKNNHSDADSGSEVEEAEDDLVSTSSTSTASESLRLPTLANTTTSETLLTPSTPSPSSSRSHCADATMNKPSNMRGKLRMVSDSSSCASSYSSSSSLSSSSLTCIHKSDESARSTSSGTDSSSATAPLLSPSPLSSPPPTSVLYPRTKPFSLSEFERLWGRVEEKFCRSTWDIELDPTIRMASNRQDGFKGQSKAPYGRIKFQAMEKILDICKASSTDTFLDIGHGIGNTCLQAAYTVGCRSLGIELVENRFAVSEQFRAGMEDVILQEEAQRERSRKERLLAEQEEAARRTTTRLQQQRRRSRELQLGELEEEEGVFRGGQVELIQGNLKDPAKREFMLQANITLVNNANDIFGCRSSLTDEATLDEYVGGIFSSMKVGAKMITLDPLLCLGRSLEEENAVRIERGMEASPDASFFTHHCISLGSNAVTWTKNPVDVHLYTRVQQSVPYAAFLCNGGGGGARNGGVAACRNASIPTAVCCDTGLLTECCVVCDERRAPFTRGRRSGRNQMLREERALYEASLKRWTSLSSCASLSRSSSCDHEVTHSGFT